MWKFMPETFVTTVFLLFLSASSSTGIHIIPSEKEITVSAGATLNLECFGSELLEWNLPSYDEGVSTKSVTTNEINDGNYKSVLKIHNIFYLDTGLYSCLSLINGSDFEEANIYIYVRDIHHLMVFNESHSLLSQLQHEPLLIPCRPTFNEVIVTLWNEHDEEIKKFPFDPHFGFMIRDPQLTDSGIYTCKATLEEYSEKYSEMSITVHITPKTDGIKKPRIIFHGEKSGSPVIIGQHIALECSVTVSLGVQIYFTWSTPDNKITSEEKLSAKKFKSNGILVMLYKSLLTLIHVTKDYEGLYVCSVSDNSNNTNQDEYNLQVYSEDTSYLNLTMEGKHFVTVRGEGSSAEWIVKIIAHPPPAITWFDPFGHKLPIDSKKYLIIHGFNSSKVIIKDARMRDSGFYELNAENTSGKKTLQVYLAVEDIPQVSVSTDAYYLKDQEYYLKCTVLAEPSANVVVNFIPCGSNKCDVSRRKSIPVFQENSIIVTKEYFGKIIAKENGIVTCNATNRYGASSNFSIFNVTDPKPPVFSEEVMKENRQYIVVPIGELVRWKCQASGLPQPMIIWYKNGVEIQKNQSKIHIKDKNETLIIPIRDKNDDGLYSCEAKNKAGTITTQFRLKLKSAFTTWIWVVAVVGILFFIVGITIVVCLMKKVRKEQRLREKITAAGLSYFQVGQIESLNPDLSVGEQADLLPYDKKWEIPREKIKLGIQLGSGAFGVVMKAEVIGLKEKDSSTTVAVKMAKKNSDVTLVKALVSELKIMSHLGQHLNVVNLIGACTSGIYSGEVLVLVEYCKFGNLHNYLLKHRDSFTNQVNSLSGNLDLSKGEHRSDNTYIASNSEIYGMGSEYGGVQSANTEITTWYGTPSVCESDQLGSAQSPVGEDGYLISKPFNKEKSFNKITTKNLICWSYQVARGMEYLASRKVLHGDLATRNILIAEGNVIKICDFGFAKSMYQDENYTKKGNDPLPLKWLSIEALRDRVFSTQSDVWAYGIVLWEIFSLAKTPYPGKQFDQQLFDSLLEGYRLEKPEYATEDMYNLMLECWKEQPMLRPSFTECADRIGSMLEESVIKHYMQLNDPYTQFNALTPADEDYLNKINCPNYSNFCSVYPSSLDSENQGSYINMSKAQEEEIEMKPMIQSGIKSFLNPGYEGLNKVEVNAQINKLPHKELNT